MSNKTPSAKWRENGDPDPHGNHYDCERAQLALGDMTDDELANALFIGTNEYPPVSVKYHSVDGELTLTQNDNQIRFSAGQIIELAPIINNIVS